MSIALQIDPMSPNKRWEDRNIMIPILDIELSLRSTMMNSLGNFIMFTAKQLCVMLMHPGTAAFELYPKIEWLEDQESRNVESELQEA